MKVDDVYLDATTIQSDHSKIAPDVLEEKVIEPAFLVEEKVAYHKAFLKDWIKKGNLDRSLGALWEIREQCIAALSQN